MTEASAPASFTASATVLKTGIPSCVVPPFPGVTPATTFVPYSTICFAWNVPSLPVRPCTTRRVDLSTRTLNDECSSTWKSGSLHQLDALTILRHVYVPTKFLFDMSGHRVCRLGFAVRQKRCSRPTAFHTFEPAQNFFPVSMC